MAPRRQDSLFRSLGVMGVTERNQNPVKVGGGQPPSMVAEHADRLAMRSVVASRLFANES